jgi:hypothetical protein
VRRCIGTSLIAARWRAELSLSASMGESGRARSAVPGRTRKAVCVSLSTCRAGILLRWRGRAWWARRGSGRWSCENILLRWRAGQEGAPGSDKVGPRMRWKEVRARALLTKMTISRACAVRKAEFQAYI